MQPTRVLLVDKEVEPLELLSLKEVCLFILGRGQIQVEKLPEVEDEKDQGA